jgi:hypothetical protein
LLATSAGCADAGDPGDRAWDEAELGALVAVKLPPGNLSAGVVEIASGADLLGAVTGHGTTYIHDLSQGAWHFKSGNYLLGIESFAQYHQDLDRWVDFGSGDKVALEFATLPPYLSAIWSFKDDLHPVAKSLRVVLQEEMLHMALACNMLVAIGGRPDITGVAPTYPVSLATAHAIAADDPAPEDGDVTIGEMYEHTRQSFHRLQPTLSTEHQGAINVSDPKQWVTSGKYKILKIYDPQYQEEFTRKDLPPELSYFGAKDAPADNPSQQVSGHGAIAGNLPARPDLLSLEVDERRVVRVRAHVLE